MKFTKVVKSHPIRIATASRMKFSEWELYDEDYDDVTIRLDILKYPDAYDHIPSTVIGAPQEDGTMYYYILDEDGDEFYEDIYYPKPPKALVQKCLKLYKEYKPYREQN